jgi:REP element-mobilizing transposase RayT
VNGEWLLDDSAKEVLRRQLWQAAEYCGVQLLTYGILSNHFHLLVRVPQKQPVTDVELVRRFRVLHPPATHHQIRRFHLLEALLARNLPDAEEWRRRQLARMGDISSFVQIVKQRFSIWFNHAHDRFGTLWAERFKSVLVESGRALQATAAYIDLNSVRAGIVADPKDYRFCGYAEAVAGNEQARQGICHLMDGDGWSAAHARYRQMLFGVGAVPREDAATITPKEFQRVLAEGGRLPLHVVLRCRVRYFTDAAVFGSGAFVETHFRIRRRQTDHDERCQCHSLPPYTDWGDLATLRRLRSGLIG